MLKAYLKAGWEDLGHSVKCPTSSYSYSISKSLFNLPETCIVIAFLETCPDENCCELNSVGPRLLDLSPKERDEFFEIYSMAETKLLALHNESENEN